MRRGGRPWEVVMKGYRRISFARKCPEIGVIVSGNVHYNLQRGESSREKWLKTGFDCDRQKDCGINPSDCPIFRDSPVSL